MKKYFFLSITLFCSCDEYNDKSMQRRGSYYPQYRSSNNNYPEKKGPVTQNIEPRSNNKVGPITASSGSNSTNSTNNSNVLKMDLTQNNSSPPPLDNTKCLDSDNEGQCQDGSKEFINALQPLFPENSPPAVISLDQKEATKLYSKIHSDFRKSNIKLNSNNQDIQIFPIELFKYCTVTQKCVQLIYQSIYIKHDQIFENKVNVSKYLNDSFVTQVSTKQLRVIYAKNNSSKLCWLCFSIGKFDGENQYGIIGSHSKPKDNKMFGKYLFTFIDDRELHKDYDVMKLKEDLYHDDTSLYFNQSLQKMWSYIDSFLLPELKWSAVVYNTIYFDGYLKMNHRHLTRKDSPDDFRFFRTWLPSDYLPDLTPIDGNSFRKIRSGESILPQKIEYALKRFYLDKQRYVVCPGILTYLNKREPVMLVGMKLNIDQKNIPCILVYCPEYEYSHLTNLQGVIRYVYFIPEIFETEQYKNLIESQS